MSSASITKSDFINYFKIPYIFWFLFREEIEDFFLNNIDQIEDTSLCDLLDFLRKIDSEKNILLSNNIQKSKFLNKKLLDFYREKFSIPFLSVYNFSFYKNSDLLEKIKSLLDSLNEVFIFRPTVEFNGVKATPSAIYKYKGKVYLIEHSWSTTLKRETLANYIYYHHVFNEIFELKIDQYLISYISLQKPKDTELILEISNLLPFSATKNKPNVNNFYKKFKNINSYFDLVMDYEDSLYEKIYTSDEYLSLNHDDWDINHRINPEKVIQELIEYRESKDNSVDYMRIVNDFFSNKKYIVQLDSNLYKYSFKSSFPFFDFSSKIFPLENSMKYLKKSLNNEKISTSFLSYISNMNFFSFETNQQNLIFRQAKEKFDLLNQITTKIYYDFESISVPWPIISGVTPYSHIVLQLSLIKVVNGKEEKIFNLIIDPKKIEIEKFKTIIDAIFLDEIDVAYIVFNKSFENSRLLEMAELIDEDEYREKVIYIIDRTIDLANWFVYGNDPFIVDRRLKGFHSIKKIINFIPDNILEETKTVKYSFLKRCGNGQIASSLFISRLLTENLDKDEVNWTKNKKFLSDYCENDVRSMIAVEKYIGKLIDENKYGFYDEEKYLEQKSNVKKMFSNK